MGETIKIVIHVIFVVAFGAWFLYSYIKERKIYQLLFVIWLPATLLTYLSRNKVYLWVLGIVQLIFFFLVIYFLFRNPNRKKAGFGQMMEQLDSYGNETEEETAPEPLGPVDMITEEDTEEPADDSSRPMP